MWVVRLEHHCGGNVVSPREVITIMRLDQFERLEDLSLTLEDGKTLLRGLVAFNPKLIVAEQLERGKEADVPCRDCGCRRWVKGYADWRLDTLFGRVTFLTGGESDLRRCAQRALGRVVTPHLDRCHLSMKITHIEKHALSLSTQCPSRREATSKMQGELERLRWRLWHGRVNAVEITRERLRDSIKVYQRPEATPKRYCAAWDGWSMFGELVGYLRSSSRADQLRDAVSTRCLPSAA